ncbi:MAG: hypothetical protein ACI4AA_11525 [Lachnospiraceae bacterium]
MKAAVKDGVLSYKKMLKNCEVPVSDLVWAYLQQEDVGAVFCCGRMNMPIGRLIALDKDGNKHVFQYEGLEEPKELLSCLQEANPQICIGYTEENRKKFETDQKDI